MLTYISCEHTHIFDKNDICNFILLDLHFSTRHSVYIKTYEHIAKKLTFSQFLTHLSEYKFHFFPQSFLCC